MTTRTPRLLVGLTIACAPTTTNTNKEEAVHNEVVAPDVGTEPSAPGVAPRWRVGDAWEVVYKISVPSYKKLADPPPAFEEHGWEYAVESIGDDGDVMIICRRTRRLMGGVVVAEVEPTEIWRMRFTSYGTLRTLEEVSDGAEPESIAFAPYVTTESGGATVRLAKEWPRFPLRPGEEGKGSEESLTQQVEERDGVLRVTMTASTSDGADTVERTVIQEWKRDRPWWSSVTIRDKSTWRGETYDDFVLEGRVTAWRLKEGE